jgi:hypothetical protein
MTSLSCERQDGRVGGLGPAATRVGAARPHTLRYMEAEHPALEIEGITEPLVPYAYEEDVSDDALTISARVRVSPTVGQALRSLWSESRAANRYLNVTRVGRDSQPREMRFGQPFWSRHDDHEKHEVILVDRAYDKEGQQQRWPTAPEQRKETGQVIQLLEQMDALLGLLVQRGRLSQQDADRVRDVPEGRKYERLLEFKRVDDLDDWA